jgi:hypothetical protein
MALQYSTTLRNTWLDAITTAVGASGLLVIRTAAAANVAAADAGTLLATLTFNATFAAGAASGVLTLNAITQDSAADATGTAVQFRAKTSGGTVIFQGTITATGGGGDLELTTTSIVTGQPVSVTSWTITAPGV